LVSGTIFFAFVENWSVLDAFYFSVTMLPPVGLGDPGTPPPPTASDLLHATLMAVARIGLILLVCAAVLLAVLYLIPLLLTELRANWLRTAWIALGVLFVVMVVVPGALLIYQYSGIGD
jgi:Ion channel